MMDTFKIYLDTSILSAYFDFHKPVRHSSRKNGFNIVRAPIHYVFPRWYSKKYSRIPIKFS